MESTKLMSNMLFSDNEEISEETIQYFEKNPEELDLIVDREVFHIAYLWFAFVLGILITILARTVQYFWGANLGDFINTVILDVISELGIAIFGGAVVGYLIEHLNKKQYEQNIKFRNQIKTVIEERKRDKQS